MKCSKCGKPVEELTELSDYGRSMFGNKDTKKYCETCFDTKYPYFKRKENEKGNE
jgi:hypothetical protein